LVGLRYTSSVAGSIVYPLVALGSSIVIGLMRTTLRRAKRRAAWARIAQQQGWSLSGDRDLTLEADVEGARVWLRRFDQDPDSCLRVAVDAKARADFAFTVRGRNRAVGSTLRVGEPFDAAFEIESNDAALARAWFDRRVRTAFRVVAGRPGDFSMRLRAGRIAIDADWPRACESDLPQLAALAALVARGERGLVERWRELAAVLGGTSSDAAWPPAPITLARPGWLVRVEIRRVSAGWNTAICWSPVEADGRPGTAHQIDLPGIVLDGGLLRQKVEESCRMLPPDSAPYR
jgi:hypothetical protein